MSSSLRLLTLALWSAVLLLSERRLLGQYVAVNAEANPVPEFEYTAADGGRCDGIHDGSSCVPQSAEECAQQGNIELQEENSGCNCSRSPLNFCEGEQARNTSADFSMNITFSILYYQKFSVMATVKNLIGPGTWDYEVMMTGEKYGATKITAGNRCACSTDHREVSINRTDDFVTEVVDGQHRSLHLCLRKGSRRVHLVQNFSVGSSCLDFADRHCLPSYHCNQPISGGSIGPVRNLAVRPATSTPLTLQVSWTKPHGLLGIHGITYYLTLNSTLGTHNFTVSDSTNITCAVRAGLNYTVTVRTWIWCETSSCQQPATFSILIPPLNRTNTPFPSPTLPTDPTTVDKETPADPYTTNGMAMVVIVGSISLSLLFLFVTVLVVVCCNWRMKKNRHSEDRPCRVESQARITTSCSTDTASTPPIDTISNSSNKISDLGPDDRTAPKQVLIVGSQRISPQEHAQLVAIPLLACTGHDIKIVQHDVDTDEADRRLTPSEWVQQAMDRAEFVVCICNKEFMEDWTFNGHRMCHERSLVRSVSHHVAGLVNHGQNNEVKQKFVTVVHCEEDLQCIPHNLKNCNSFILNYDADVNRLARFLLEIPAVTFSDRIDHISSRL